MCNLYNVTRGPDAIRRLFQAAHSHVGNLEPGDVYPDYPAPIVRMDEMGERELVRARWGMPSPAFALKDKKADPRRHQHPQHHLAALAALAIA